MKRETNQTYSENASAVLAAIMRTFGYKDPWLADVLDVSRPSAQKKRKGETRLSVDEIGELCEALALPVWIFYQSPAESIRWILDHPNRTLQMKYYGGFAAVAA